MAKILLGSSERHRLATADYLASLLDGTSEINRVGKVRSGGELSMAMYREWLLTFTQLLSTLQGAHARGHGRHLVIRQVTPQGRAHVPVGKKWRENQYGKGEEMAAADFHSTLVQGNNLGLAGAKQLCALLLDPSLRLQVTS